MRKIVEEYLKSLDKLYEYFGCEKDFPVKPLIDYKWQVRNNPDISLITYWNDTSNIKNAVIVKRMGSPMIFKTSNFTMIVAIDCVKTAFLLSNANIYQGM